MSRNVLKSHRFCGSELLGLHKKQLSVKTGSQRKGPVMKQRHFILNMPLHMNKESHVALEIFICFFALLSSIVINPAIDSNAFAGEAKQNDKITIVTAGTVARLCPHPGCGPDKHITRIPEGTVLSVEGTEDYTIGTFKVKWFEVIYKENRGWISIYDTDKAP
jgi:hypothetical protein